MWKWKVTFKVDWFYSNGEFPFNLFDHLSFQIFGPLAMVQVLDSFTIIHIFLRTGMLILLSLAWTWQVPFFSLKEELALFVCTQDLGLFYVLWWRDYVSPCFYLRPFKSGNSSKKRLFCQDFEDKTLGLDSCLSDLHFVLWFPLLDGQRNLSCEKWTVKTESARKSARGEQEKEYSYSFPGNLMFFRTTPAHFQSKLSMGSDVFN